MTHTYRAEALVTVLHTGPEDDVVHAHNVRVTAWRDEWADMTWWAGTVRAFSEAVSGADFGKSAVGGRTFEALADFLLRNIPKAVQVEVWLIDEAVGVVATQGGTTNAT